MRPGLHPSFSGDAYSTASELLYLAGVEIQEISRTPALREILKTPTLVFD